MGEVRINRIGFSADGQFLNVTAKSEDHGPHNEVQVHLWDGNQAGDVPMRWVAKDGSQDVFELKLPVDDLNRNTFNLFELGATGRMTEPHTEPFWEGRDHQVLPERRGRTVNVRHQGPMQPIQGRSVEPWSGPVEVTVQREPARGNPIQKNRAHLTQIRWTNQDAGDPIGPERMEVAIFAYLESVNQGQRSTIDLRRRYNLVTLERQADGSYLATAPAGKSFLSVDEQRGPNGETVLKGFKFALHNPTTGVWDKGLHAEYLAPI